VRTFPDISLRLAILRKPRPVSDAWFQPSSDTSVQFLETGIERPE
jgi:hypothetical protein